MREKIWEGMESIIASCEEPDGVDAIRATRLLVEYLDSQGVVLKVEGEPLSCGISQVLQGNAQPIGCPFRTLNYTAWETLIEVVKVESANH